MHQIRFLRNFSARRVIKGRFDLKSRDAATVEQGFAFNHRLHQFRAGETASVNLIIRKQFGSLLVVTDNPIVGEVVLDDAVEGVDFEVIT